MLFKRNYSIPGPGIDPDEPEKFGFDRFCEIMTLECRTLLKLNVMTLFASIPIVTAPIALCAMNAVIRKMILDEPVECGYDFRTAFARYWKQSYLIFLLGIVVPLLSGVGSLFYARMATSSSPVYFIPCVISLFIFLATLLSSAYLYPLLDMGLPLKDVLQHAFRLGIGKPLRAILCYGINAGLALLSFFFFPLSLPYLLLVGFSCPCLLGQFWVRLNLRKFAGWLERQEKNGEES